MTTLEGFWCPHCQFVGWPFLECCPKCGGGVDTCTIDDVLPASVRDARASSVGPDGFCVITEPTTGALSTVTDDPEGG